MALIVKDVARNLFQVEVYDERNSKYEVQSIISIETDTDVKYNAINEKYLIVYMFLWKPISLCTHTPKIIAVDTA